MVRHVRGVLFVDYVRIIRAFKEVRWTEHLSEEDLPWLSQTIERDEWYPMDSYERMGLAILEKVAGGSLALIRRWGRESVHALHEMHPQMIVEGNPRETLKRLEDLRESLFDFPALELRFVGEGEILLDIDFGMSPRAEEAACHQTLGFIERVLEMSGAGKISVEPLSRSWAGNERTVIRARWKVKW